jgi:hypothetical protein
MNDTNGKNEKLVSEEIARNGHGHDEPLLSMSQAPKAKVQPTMFPGYFPRKTLINK